MNGLCKMKKPWVVSLVKFEIITKWQKRFTSHLQRVMGLQECKPDIPGISKQEALHRAELWVLPVISHNWELKQLIKVGIWKAMGKYGAQTQVTNLLTSHPDNMLINLLLGQGPTMGVMRKC